MGNLAFFEEIIGELGVIKRFSSKNDRMLGLESLEENMVNIGVTTSDAADDLGDELKSAFFGGVVRKVEVGISLDDSDGV